MMNSDADPSTNSHPSPVEPFSDLSFPGLTRLSRFILQPSSFILCSVLLALAPLASLAETEGPYTYSVTAGKATITDFSTSYSGTVSIATTLGGFPVVCIGYHAFWYHHNITGVTIPGTVSVIEKNAFNNCHGLAHVSIGNGVTAIGESAFGSCYFLESITIPGSVTSFGYNSFSGCTNLTSVTIGQGVPTIGDGAFTLCSSLTGVTIPDSVTRIGNNAFDRCTRLASVTIPDSVTHIGSYAFQTCTSLHDITIPDSVTNIGQYTFAYCTGLTDVTLGAGVMIDGGTSGSGSSSFRYCSSLTTATFHNNLKNFVCSKMFGDYGGALKSVVIGDGIPSIPSGAFNNCIYLTSVTIGAGVTNIGSSAFMSCTALPSVTIPDSVTRIESSAFGYCTGLTSVTIGSDVTYIGSYAFYGCTGLTGVIFARNAPTLGDPNVFNGVPATFYYRPNTSGWGATFGGRPTLCWNPQVRHDASFGFASDRFGFTIACTSNIPIVVQATTNLSSGVWTSLTNTTLGTSGSLYFTDPSSTNLASRYYRIVWP